MQHFIFWVLIYLSSLSNVLSLDSKIIMGPLKLVSIPTKSEQHAVIPPSMSKIKYQTFRVSGPASRYVPSSLHCFNHLSQELLRQRLSALERTLRSSGQSLQFYGWDYSGEASDNAMASL